ncbi:FAD-dependent monooxygenase [Nostoc sp. UHCC 0702]|nr:FAD-dependent monooxygenase [Nostoc sp. UHCC 0702]
MPTEKSLTPEIKHSHGSVLIVGGGPAGLATALMLAKRGWTNITILEKRAAADYYEPDKSFNYLIDGRGQKFTDMLGISDHLAEIGVSNTEFYLTRIKPDGSRKTAKLPTINPNRKTAYWMPRRAFVFMLYQEIVRHWSESITVLFNTSCVQINKTTKLEIVAEDEKGTVSKFTAALLVGCDGLNSIVGNTLKEWDKSISNKFEMKYFPSASSGLRYKVLSLPPNFPLDSTANEHAVCDMAYAIRGAFPERKRSVSLGILPIKNPEEPRTANIITRPNNAIWELKNSAEVYNFFEKAFPQLPINQILSPEEVERFALSEGGYFPIPQYCSGLQFLLTPVDTTSTAGVVLLGDAIHCFPPDLGQGVNSALEDVCVLNQALSESDDDLDRALPLYESLRLADTEALVRLVQIGYPWQYNQAPLRSKLWNINFLIRLLLSRLLPFIFSPPAFFLIQNSQLSYKEIWVMVQRTTKSLYVLGFIVICGFLVLTLRIALKFIG